MIATQIHGTTGTPRTILDFVHEPEALDGALNYPVPGTAVAREGLKGMGLEQVITAASEAFTADGCFRTGDLGERLLARVVAPQPWSVEDGCLTPTFEIKRSRIEAILESQAPRWYEQGSPVVRATS